MNADRWKEVTHIYDAVMARGPHERADAVIALCGDDLDLRRNVESLLDASHERSMVLDRPVGEVAAAMMDPTPSLAPGTVVGSYRIAGLLGVGGMGEVYRARDTRLNRDVAIKVLPAAFASDPERLARFKREAQVLAALNHPNIAAIYGLEELKGRGAQTPQGTCIVMELVDGPTLAERIPAPGSTQPRTLRIDEALAIARQIANALAAAHEQGSSIGI